MKNRIALLLAGSVCMFTGFVSFADEDKQQDDKIEHVEKDVKNEEEAEHRIQITGSMNRILDAISDVVGYNSSASLSAIQNNGVAAGTEIIGGDTFTNDTNDLTSISRGLSAIEGADFDTTLASLNVIALQTVLGQVIAAASNPAINLPVPGATNAGTFNTAMDAIFVALNTALITPNNTNIDALLTLIDTLAPFTFTGTITATSYQSPSINAALRALQNAVTNWLAFYPA